MSTDTPTPNPLSAQPGFDLNEARAERDRLAADLADASQEIARLMRELEFARAEAKSIYDTCKQIERERDQIIADLPARDARIRAEVAEEIARAIEAEKPSVSRFWDTADAARVYALNDAAKVARSRAGKGFPGVAAGSAVPAEGSVHPQPATEPHCVQCRPAPVTFRCREVGHDVRPN